MPPESSVDILNRLLRIIYRSLPMYLAGTSPWTSRSDARAEAVLAQLVGLNMPTSTICRWTI